MSSYSILSNGSDYAFFIQKSFIKEFLNPGDKLKLNFEKEVFHVLTISIFDDEFFDVIKLFSQDTYHEIFSQLAKFTLTRINQTRPTKIVDDKPLNSWLQKKIEQTLDIKHGEYLKDIEEGKIHPNQKLVYKNGFVEIEVIVMNNGQVKLPKGNAKLLDMIKTLNSEFAPMIDIVRDEWIKNDVIFNSTSEIIKIVRERLKKDKFIFKKS